MTRQEYLDELNTLRAKALSAQEAIQRIATDVDTLRSLGAKVVIDISPLEAEVDELVGRYTTYKELWT